MILDDSDSLSWLFGHLGYLCRTTIKRAQLQFMHLCTTHKGYTLFPKRNATLISRFFMVTVDQGQWPRVMCTKGNAPESNRQKTPSKNIKRFCQYTRSNAQMKFAPKFTDLHSSPKERQLQKSCVSFGEECTISCATGSVEKMDLQQFWQAIIVDLTLDSCTKKTSLCTN